MGRSTRRGWFAIALVPLVVAVSLAAPGLLGTAHAASGYFNGYGADSYAWLPFGGGIRRCIGAALAQAEMAEVLRLAVRAVELRPLRERPDPVVVNTTDAVVRVVLGCVCGSDLWYYRGESPHDLGPIGHESIGVVEDTVGDFLAATARSQYSLVR